MVFSSLLFLFVYLPVTLTGFYLLDKKYRYYFLLLANLLFYAWGERTYVILLLVFIVCNYLFGILIQFFKDKKKTKSAKLVVTCGVIFNLLILIFYKYSFFLASNVLNLLNIFNIDLSYQPVPSHLPIGVSFFTFQAVSYLVDIYRSEVVATKNLLNFALYKSFFPQLIAGPIVRYKDVHEQFEQKKSVKADEFVYGIERFVLGLGKKVIIANTLAQVADKVFSLPVNEISIGTAWLGAICYTAQIYFDFSGYSDMAIGMARMFGFKFLENFNFPYVSKSIQDFWRRWHISLSSWFRDYLYIPLGGNRVGKYRTYINQLIVFLLCGLWHGAAWTFIAWGIWHGSFLILERLRFGTWIKKAPAPIAHFYTMLVVITGWVIFRSETIAKAWNYLGVMYGVNHSAKLYYIKNYLNIEVIVMLFLALAASLPLSNYASKVKILFRRDSSKLDWGQRFRYTAFVTLYSLFIFAVLIFSIMYLASGTYNPFIYYRF